MKVSGPKKHAGGMIRPETATRRWNFAVAAVRVLWLFVAGKHCNTTDENRGLSFLRPKSPGKIRTFVPRKSQSGKTMKENTEKLPSPWVSAIPLAVLTLLL